MKEQEQETALKSAELEEEKTKVNKEVVDKELEEQKERQTREKVVVK